MSEKPTSHVGSASAKASQSSRSTTSMAVSPPHGGMTQRTSGSHSIAVSSAARRSADPDVIPDPSMHSPTTTSYPAARSQSTQKATRSVPAPVTPAEGAVTAIVSPGPRRVGKRSIARSCQSPTGGSVRTVGGRL